MQNDPAKSKYFQSLNGNWKFKWVDKPANRPLGFWKTNYDETIWAYDRKNKSVQRKFL